MNQCNIALSKKGTAPNERYHFKVNKHREHEGKIEFKQVGTGIQEAGYGTYMLWEAGYGTH